MKLAASILRHIRAVPPSAAKSLKQCRRVRVAIGLRLHEIDHCLLVALFGIQQRQVIYVACTKLFRGQVQRDGRGILCGSRGFLGVGILLQRI